MNRDIEELRDQHSSWKDTRSHTRISEVNLTEDYRLAIQCSAVQCSVVQCSAVLCSACSVVQCVAQCIVSWCTVKNRMVILERIFCLPFTFQNIAFSWKCPSTKTPLKLNFFFAYLGVLNWHVSGDKQLKNLILLKVKILN